MIARSRLPLASPLAVLLCLALSLAVYGAEPLTATLDNGLDVAILEDVRAPIVTVRLYVGAGSMHEQGRMGSGISHLLEHLVSGGPTQKRSEEEGKKLLASIGGQANAYTTHDHTCYHITTLSKHLDVALDLLSEWVLNATLPQEQFDREMAVVKQEVGTRQIEPIVKLHEVFLETLFTSHPFRYRVIGYEDVLSRIKREDALDYYRRMYVPNNMLLVVAGDVTSGQALEKVRKVFGPFARGAQPDLTLPQEPAQLGERRIVQRLPVSTGYLLMGFRTIPLSHPDLYALDLADYILSQGNSSRLVRKLRDEEQLVQTIASWSYTPAWDAGNFAISATVAPEKAEEAQQAILRELRSLAATPPSAEELLRAKKQKLADRHMALQTVEDRAENLASDILQAHTPQFTDLYTQRIQAVTAGEVTAAAAKYFRTDALTTVCFLPEAPKGQEKAAVPAAEPASAVRKAALKNGMRVLLKRNPLPPLVSVQAYFMGGVRLETEANNGISHLMASLLTRGTTTRTAADIARSLDAMGATLSAASGNNTLYIRGECLSSDLAPFMEIFADVVCNPVFDTAELQKRRTLQLAALDREKDDLHETSTRFLRSKFFAGAPYRLMPLGTPESVRALKKVDLVKFHREYCVPNNLALSVFGDIDVEKALALVEERFAGFKPNPDVKLPAAAKPVVLDRDLRFEQKVEKEMTMVYVAYPGMTFADAQDRAAMSLADSVLSGVRIPSGWIHDELRGKGLVYETHAMSWVGIDPGFFAIYAVTNPHQVEEVLAVMRKHVQRLARERLGERDLQLARDNCIISEAMELQTNGDQAADAALNELYGLGFDFTQKYLQSLASVTAGDVMQVARKYLSRGVTVVVGPEEKR